MQKQTSIYIPNPCHEDWNKMTSTQQGKFCSACNKQVVDFNLMSDNQILNFLSTQSGKLCGRFDAEQLQRPLVETKIKKKKSWWMALTMPLLFLFDKTYSQGTPAVIVKDTTISPTCKQPEVMGKLAYQPTKQITIKGKVVDEKNEPIIGATIIQIGSKNATTTDSTGKFSLSVSSYEDTVKIMAMFVGYESVEKKILKLEQTYENITMQLKPTISGEVVVVGYTVRHKPVKQIDTIKTAIKKICRISSFKIYPNPIFKGEAIHFEIKQTGNYQMQLLDNQTRLMQTEEINVDAKNITTQIQLQSNISAGMYYLRLINEQTKKQYTEKLIIQ